MLPRCIAAEPACNSARESLSTRLVADGHRTVFAALPNRFTTRLQGDGPSTKLMRANALGGFFSSSARACGATNSKDG